MGGLLRVYRKHHGALSRTDIVVLVIDVPRSEVTACSEGLLNLENL